MYPFLLSLFYIGYLKLALIFTLFYTSRSEFKKAILTSCKEELEDFKGFLL
jgi:hypothetical protein